MKTLNTHHRVEVLSGPFGSEAAKHGLTTQRLLAERPDIAREILQQYKDAGATVPVTPTFGATTRSKEEAPFDDGLKAWNASAVRLTQEVFANRNVVASVAPILDTSGADDAEWSHRGELWAWRRHAPQAVALRKAGAKRFLGEAFRYVGEGKGLAQLLADLGAEELICAFEARHPEGKFPHQPKLTFEQVLNELVEAARGKLRVGIGINCNAAADCRRVLEKTPAGVIKAVYPNKAKVGSDAVTARFLHLAESLERSVAEDEEYHRLREQLETGDQALRDLAELSFEKHVQLVGICCGGTAEDVRLLRKVADAYNTRAQGVQRNGRHQETELPYLRR